ncbi:MAG: 2-amino-4-oxopentanoate thiolase subunit OrtA [Synergistaceae bacterium]|nr:2-amino-4-oxopentanoate thiolase subunit OrtA [Synergistaceae bacterium]NCC57168.1 2-amino-4-ketopentanoate thiolase [Synergistales bacterium]MDD3391310.1 2-amino-4-oxopentanoate thiolase subunit OrtA [Synergistaceae bacterium]MDD3689249.1 2-amino-4-oxopentanoate thiolase subunit OrtA [Synergistaceae bacterium]MDD4020963.1 2-amino-4-oxopentanoate thiolase subunit OrtA [Synergistaceae bacterium]
MDKIRKGSWVQIEWTLLEPWERPEHLPPETRQVPLRMRAKGILQEEASTGEPATVISTCGRTLTGTLVAENPPFTHSFGPQIPEFIGLGDFLRSQWRSADE